MLAFRSLAVVAVLCLGGSLLADDKKNEADLKALVGDWKVEKAEIGGKDITEHLKVLKFDIREGGKYTAQVGEEKDDAAFTVDAAKAPKEMDVKPNGGPHRGKTVKAIYKLDGNTLTICYDYDIEKGKRPEKFESKADTMLLLVTYTRGKK
ncbi:MAG: TIGR03067 domain-containing protein [Planctomycetes bacterium]|nr:TIGR03067 domain-containing protein [Planctomycetota bacterium]